MPGLFEQFPHTNLHELNLDWIIDLINKFKEELEDSAVLSVNGETGHVTLYESENVILPALPSGVDQWRLVRMMNGQYAGILFYNGNVYLQRGNSNMRLLTLEDIPTSAGVVAWNGRTGIVNVTGQDIPVDDTADADSIEQAIKNEHTERVNADNALQNSIGDINQNISNCLHKFLIGQVNNTTPITLSVSSGNISGLLVGISPASTRHIIATIALRIGAAYCTTISSDLVTAAADGDHIVITSDNVFGATLYLVPFNQNNVNNLIIA